jgi:hypothetical protein
VTEEPSVDSILSGASNVTPEPSRIVDEPEGIITDLADGKPSAIEVEPGEDRDEPTGRVPIGKIKEAEREKVAKRYTEQVADFQQTIQQMRAEQAERDRQWEQRLLQVQRPQEQPKPETDPLTAFFDDPRAAVRGEVQPLLEQIQQQVMAQAQLVATSVHGAERVQTAEQAFLQAINSKQLDPADYHRVINSPNRWDAAVQWHKRQSALSEIGDDPAAFRERIRAETIAEIQKTGRIPDFAAPGAAQPGVMPSNFADARNAGNRVTGPGPQDDASISEILASKQRGSIFK